MGRGKEIIAQLNSAQRVNELSKLLKEAQQYTVNLYPNELAHLRREGAIVEHLEGMIYEIKANWYSEEYGVDLKGEGGWEYYGW